MGFDDKLRKKVIFDLICHFETNKRDIEREFNILFDDYFENERLLLADFKADGLVIETDEMIKVTNKGRLLIRNICMMFDAYLNELQLINSYSKVI